MAVTIAIAGKGGTGKTTLAALIIKYLITRGEKPILAVDADANWNLNEVLGVQVAQTVGDIREEMKKKVSNLPGGMTKQQFLEYKIEQSLVESPDFDLLVMGRPEGPGCYCYANAILRDILQQITRRYRFVVIDNEAGMEHLSRRTTQNVDHLVVVSDATLQGIRTAARISQVVEELKSRIGNIHLVINRINRDLSEGVLDAIKSYNLKLAGTIPFDEKLAQWDCQGKSLFEVVDGSKIMTVIGKIVEGAIF